MAAIEKRGEHSYISILREYKVWQNQEKLSMSEAWQGHNRVFAQDNGKPIFHGTPSYWFKKFIRKHNLPEITFHQLRHTNATLLIGQGVDVKTVASRLGHAWKSTTTDIYSPKKQQINSIVYLIKSKRQRSTT